MKASLHTRLRKDENRGFALVSTLMLMILLMLLAVGMLSLSTVSVRSSNTDSANQQARANARMALMIAVGELQKEMGPDMRISAEAAIHDTDPATEKIDGVDQAHWLAVYDSWGNWINAEYTPEGKPSSGLDGVKNIQDTYVAKRAPMFRRWLVSLPEKLKTDVNAAATALSEEETVLMVGEGTLGKDHAAAHPEKVTRAYKIQTHNSGAFAWWVSPENHKAKINLAAQKRDLKEDQWAVGQGITSEVAVGGLAGLDSLNNDKPEAVTLAQRIISLRTLGLPSVSSDQDASRQLFFDLTEASSGVLTNTRSGGLKKDLSLLFENYDATIPSEYTQAPPSGATHSRAQEPSIRPHSKDILAENAVLPRRPFASWSNMRHYYRMYRQDKDELLKKGFTGQSFRNLQKDADGIPLTEQHSPDNTRDNTTEWQGQNSYLRIPILARYLLIHGYKTEVGPGVGQTTIRYIDIPVVTLWNPYSVPLKIKNGSFGLAATSMQAWPNRLVVNQSGVETEVPSGSYNLPVAILSEDGLSDTIFQPGEFKVFSFSGLGAVTGNLRKIGYREGFDPELLGGVLGGSRVVNTTDIGSITLDVKHSPIGNSNDRDGNTPGSPSLRMGRNTNAQPDNRDDGTPAHYQIDWFQKSQKHQSLLGGAGNRVPLLETQDPLPIAYSMITLKTTNSVPPAVGWAKDWRSRNWLHAPPYGFGGQVYMSEDATTAHTQRLESSYTVSFGPASDSELGNLTHETNDMPWLGVGLNPYEQITAVPAIELPSAPLSSLASFSGMRTNPGWVWPTEINPDWYPRVDDGGKIKRPKAQYCGFAKTYQYQSGVTGGGISNSFAHPMIPREKVYHYHNNSVSTHWEPSAKSQNKEEKVDTKAYCDYWDHTFVLNDALWDEYFISSIADQTRPWASAADNLNSNIKNLTTNKPLPISRYQYHDGGLATSAVESKLKQDDGYLRAAEHLTVDGAFNVNSTSVNAWYALFKGIRERKLFYRDTKSGKLTEVAVPNDHIAISRLDTPTSDKETTNLNAGVKRSDDQMEWSGVRFLDDSQIRLLAEKCVEQVKKRGPFLNFSEFINRRLDNNEMGLMGALQSAIDYDDDSPESGSINYRYKETSSLMMTSSKLGTTDYKTPEAADGSRLAGIPGYVIQSDILKPISNTLQVRDDTFRIRAYGEALDAKGNVTARAWCEALIQRTPDYVDESNVAHEGAFNYEASSGGFDPRWNGEFVPNSSLTETNRKFGRKFKVTSFRWLNSDEI